MEAGFSQFLETRSGFWAARTACPTRLAGGERI